jgi:hypothetical protein
MVMAASGDRELHFVAFLEGMLRIFTNYAGGRPSPPRLLQLLSRIFG